MYSNVKAVLGLSYGDWSGFTEFRKLSAGGNCFVICTPAWRSRLQLNVYTCFSVFLGVFPLRNMERTSVDAFQHYKYYHFFALCFGLGCGTALYRPFRSLTVPSVVGVFFAIVFEIVGVCFDIPAHTSRCKGPPYDKRDVYWGFCFALFVAYLHLHSYHVYTLSYGCGIIVFALRGAKRRYSYLRKLRERRSAW
ncbi:uncharacterized protein LOC125006834 [Mugil cephalus]|uniref:uncharacterized protein LOC125006834 n=1 Tax=Mugil cephalus TaxID=48193 RepID=UPI001FB5A224|nr:uncharacterized protein LOC125006834 [Mugil cephalus]